MKSNTPFQHSDNDLLSLNHCILCPRECGVDRNSGALGFCGEGAALYAARAALMFYEEPCISGTAGSGAVFFDGCNLGCVFCQNASISKGLRGPVHGKNCTPSRLCDIFLELEEKGANNINLVTASHYLPLVITALERAKNAGLHIPVVYNTSAYEKKEAIRHLDGLVDIYLPDLKFYDSALSARYTKAADYFEQAAGAIEEMVRQQPVPVFADGTHELPDDPDAEMPLMRQGVIVRHLCMPGHTDDSKKILNYLYHTYGDQIFISIMNQYTPMETLPESVDPLLLRSLTDKEYEAVTDYAIELGITNGFLQEGGTVSESFIPLFDGTGV